MMNKLYSLFEGMIEPFPQEEPTTPPSEFIPFVWYYSKGIWPWLALLGALSVIAAVLEIILFGYVGNVVDWLSTANRETFLEDEGGKLEENRPKFPRTFHRTL